MKTHSDAGKDTDDQHSAENSFNREGGIVGRKCLDDQGRFGRGAAGHRPSGPQCRKFDDERQRHRE